MFQETNPSILGVGINKGNVKKEWGKGLQRSVCTTSKGSTYIFEKSGACMNVTMF